MSESPQVDLSEVYTTRLIKIDNGKKYWNSINVEILQNNEVIGSYIRNYHAMYRTFYPFECNGKHYALYSKDYQTTSIMSLPDCKHLGDAESGFCPVDFFVPTFENSKQSIEFYEDEIRKEQSNESPDETKITQYKASLQHYQNDCAFIGKLGVVAGCYWGDDSGGWKLQMLHLDPENGKVKIDGETLGYFELSLSNEPLSKKIDWDEPQQLNIPINTLFNLNLEDFSKSEFSHYSFDGMKIGKEE